MVLCICSVIDRRIHNYINVIISQVAQLRSQMSIPCSSQVTQQSQYEDLCGEKWLPVYLYLA